MRGGWGRTAGARTGWSAAWHLAGSPTARSRDAQAVPQGKAAHSGRDLRRRIHRRPANGQGADGLRGGAVLPGRVGSPLPPAPPAPHPDPHPATRADSTTALGYSHTRTATMTASRAAGGDTRCVRGSGCRRLDRGVVATLLYVSRGMRAQGDFEHGKKSGKGIFLYGALRPPPLSPPTPLSPA